MADKNYKNYISTPLLKSSSEIRPGVYLIFIMFYHPNDNLFTVIIKHLVGFAALIALFALLVYAIFDDAQIPQRDITLLINIDDQVNICRPDEDGFAEKSFFNF